MFLTRRHLTSGAIIGIHRAGFFMYRNEAIDGPAFKAFIDNTLT